MSPQLSRVFNCCPVTSDTRKPLQRHSPVTCYRIHIFFTETGNDALRAFRFFVRIFMRKIGYLHLPTLKIKKMGLQVHIRTIDSVKIIVISRYSRFASRISIGTISPELRDSVVEFTRLTWRAIYCSTVTTSHCQHLQSNGQQWLQLRLGFQEVE
mgnify:CR=1 FL=1